MSRLSSKFKVSSSLRNQPAQVGQGHLNAPWEAVALSHES